MKKLPVQRSLRFDPDQYQFLKDLASTQTCSISDVLRTIIAHYRDRNSMLTTSQRRQARISEYAQVALDAIIREQHPEYRDRILEETNRRMERYHGA